MPAHKDDLLNDLVKAIKETKDNMAKFLPEMESSVNNIIQRKSSNIQEIEHLLDAISSLMYMGLGHNLYLKLLEYYKTVDSEGADFYWGAYEETTE